VYLLLGGGMLYDLTSTSWGPEEIQALNRVVESGMLTMGTNVAAFEQAFADKFGMKFGVMVNSGSSANLVGIAAYSFKKDRPLRPGDEVIVPAISWATTYYPLLQYGLKLKFVDVDLPTLNMDVKQLKAALTPKTRMVVAVSILGNPCDLDVMRAFCDEHGLYLFEDNCESMGAKLKGKLTGTFGDLTTFSFFFSHHISTMEGGIILTNDEELYHLSKSLRAHGWTRNLPEHSPIYEKKYDDFYEAYRFILPGYNVRPLEIAAAVGLEQIKKLDAMIDIRRRNAQMFLELFRNDSRFILQKENGESSWFSFTMIVNPELRLERAKVFDALRKGEIGYRIITGGNFLRHDVIKYFNYERVGEIRNADIAHDRGFFVGNHPIDLSKQLEQLHSALKSVG
jgi:CDP-4-dehydro-6-deoxyglucose reductase, E1